MIAIFGAMDSCGLSGIHADSRVFDQFNLQPVNVITAITVQNESGIVDVQETSVSLLEQYWQNHNLQKADVIKISVLVSVEQLEWLTHKLSLTNNETVVIYDPVLSPTNGGWFFKQQPTKEQWQSFFNQITIITPNLPELGFLTDNKLDLSAQIAQLLQMGVAHVYVKGGHGIKNGFVVDQYASVTAQYRFEFPKQAVTNVRATGCCFASALAVYLKKKKPVLDAMCLAGALVQQGIESATQNPLSAGLKLFSDVNKVTLKHFANVGLSGIEFDNKLSFTTCGDLGLYPVVDTVDWVKKLCDWGVPTLQLRIKDRNPETLVDELKAAIEYAQLKNVRLFINDYWQLAIELNAYGVHLGQEDLHTANLNQIAKSGLTLGVSTHSELEWCIAKAINPSYIALGAVFATQTKKVQLIGLENLNEWVKLLQPNVPVTAIGGIGLKNINKVLASKTKSVALVSAITKADDPKQVTQTLLALLDKN